MDTGKSCATAAISTGMTTLVLRRSSNRHRRTQSSPLNLPVDIPEGSSGDEAVSSPGTQARERDHLLHEVSNVACLRRNNVDCYTCFSQNSKFDACASVLVHLILANRHACWSGVL